MDNFLGVTRQGGNCLNHEEPLALLDDGRATDGNLCGSPSGMFWKARDHRSGVRGDQCSNLLFCSVSLSLHRLLPFLVAQTLNSLGLVWRGQVRGFSKFWSRY